jgi:hypothetical protein
VCARRRKLRAAASLSSFSALLLRCAAPWLLCSKQMIGAHATSAMAAAEMCSRVTDDGYGGGRQNLSTHGRIVNETAARCCCRCCINALFLSLTKTKTTTKNKTKQFVADGVFYAELNELLMRELAEHGYSGVEVRTTPMRTEIIIRATRTQSVLGESRVVGWWWWWVVGCWLLVLVLSIGVVVVSSFCACVWRTGRLLRAAAAACGARDECCRSLCLCC